MKFRPDSSSPCEHLSDVLSVKTALKISGGNGIHCITF